MIRAAVLGADVSKSRSPAIHNAAFRALGVEGEYARISVTPRGFRAAGHDAAREGYRYLNVTIPHKAAAAAWPIDRRARGARLGRRQHADLRRHSERAGRAPRTPTAPA